MKRLIYPGNWFRGIVDLLFGFDFFISYAHDDGRNYPQRLAQRLEEAGFKVFLDTRIYVAGDNLRVATRRRIQMSKKLVVIVRPQALQSYWVSKEIQEYRTTRRTPIAIDINNTLEKAPEDNYIKQQFSDIIYISESSKDFDDEPSGHVITELISSFNSVRNEVRRLRIVSMAAVILGIVAMIAIWQYMLAEKRHKIAYSRQLAVYSQTQFSSDPELSVLLALEALSVKQTAEAEESLKNALPLLFIKTTLHGHKGTVQTAHYNHDATRVVTSSFDNTARVWDANKGELLAELKGHKGPLSDATFSTDGRRVVTASLDKTARIWDAQSGALLHILEGHKRTIIKARFTPNGKRVVTASFDQTIRLWDVFTGKNIAKFNSPYGGYVSADGKWFIAKEEGQKNVIWDAENSKPVVDTTDIKGTFIPGGLSKDGKQIVTEIYEYRYKLLVWDLHTDKSPEKLIGHDVPMISAVFSSNGNKLITTSNDYTAYIWHLRPKQAPIILRGHTGVINDAAFSPDSRWVVTASVDRTTRVWDAISGRLIAELRGHKDRINSVTFNNNGKFILTAGDTTARIWRFTTTQAKTTFFDKNMKTDHVAINQNGRLMVSSGNAENHLIIWGVKTGIRIRRIKLEGFQLFVDFHPSGAHIVSAGFDGTVRVWDELKGRVVDQFKGHKKPVWCVAFSPDGKSVLSAGNDGKIYLWRHNRQKPIIEFRGHSKAVASIRFSPDGKIFASGSFDKSARLWDASTGTEVAGPLHHNSAVVSVAFNHDGTRLITSNLDNTAYIWDTISHERIAKLEHPEPLRNAEFTPNGRWVVTACNDNQVRVWDAVSGQYLSGMRVQKGPVKWVTLSHDGHWLFTVESDGAVRLYPWEMAAPLKDLIAIAKERLFRSLTIKEKEKFLQ